MTFSEIKFRVRYLCLEIFYFTPAFYEFTPLGSDKLHFQRALSCHQRVYYPETTTPTLYFDCVSFANVM